jgi:hypothetical protein
MRPAIALPARLTHWLGRTARLHRWAGDRRPARAWSIGIFTGTSPLDLAPPDGVRNPVLSCQDISDVPARVIADPFMTRVGGRWHMFFEVLNERTWKGEIGLATSDDAAVWTYQGIVLAEPFHLSYPYVFVWQDDYYMIPETGAVNAVRLYKAAAFPARWSLAAVLLEGRHFVDASIFRRDGRWWLFTETSPTIAHDTLRLYGADHLLGPWVEHPASPTVAGDPHTARPAGRVIVDGGRVIRYAQDCAPRYGLRVRAFEVTTLTPQAYAERPAGSRPILDGSGAGWNAGGMHHVDAHPVADGRWLACVDGWMRPGDAGP